ncbi:MAG: phosphopyruvate hydratase [Patescibacteria group bacterium]
MAIIKDLRAREILDSRSNPTIACEVLLDDESYAMGFVPTGVSKSKQEAAELRDNDPNRFGGKGVLKAVQNINTSIRDAVMGMDASKLASVDYRMIELDGTKDKSKLGANSTLAVSLAVAKAAAKSAKEPLYRYLADLMDQKIDRVTMPLPFMNILNGGKHAVGSTDFQEFMIVPVNFPSFKDALRAGSEIFQALGQILKERNYQTLVGDEGGFAPSLFSNEQGMELLMMAIAEANYTAGEDIFIALDPAASRFFEDDMYQLHRENKSLTSIQIIDFYENWCEKYPIIAIEDPLDLSDWNGWRDITQRIGEKIEVIGDDIYATNKELLKKGIESKTSTGILIKPNQIGTLSETLETMKLAADSGFKVIVSHRSGETEDTFIADLAVASGCGVIKAGAPCRSERTAKYNRLLEIEDKAGEKATLAKWDTTGNEGTI